MRTSESPVAYVARKMRGSRLHRGAMDCTTKIPAVARALWPDKTAANWAAAAGVKERMAKYWLSGTHPVSDSGKLAIIRELD